MKHVETVFGVAIALLLAATVVVPADAKFARGEMVPLARLFKNVGAYVAAHPRDAAGHYTLGRLHSLAFVKLEAHLAYGTREGDENTLPALQFEGDAVQAGGINPDKDVEAHLGQSIREYRKATELAPKDPLYWMGLGWMLEQGSSHAAVVPAPFERIARIEPVETWRTEAVKAYRRAYALSVVEDLKKEHSGPRPFDMISMEAGEGIIRLLGTGKNADEKAELARVEHSIAEIKKKPHYVTPMLFPLERSASLAELLDSQRTTQFDLLGHGQGERWPWVTPKAGILVWDPAHTGRIASGRQLFGTFSWSMFWSDGYAALAALDDNGDGYLSGLELEGISVWRDLNGNGISDPGEVMPIRDLGVESISVRSKGRKAGTLTNPNGIRFEDGSFRASFDWAPTSVPESLRLPLCKQSR